MSDLDIRLTAALNADPPPAQDAKFRVEVLLRIERARFKRRVVMTLAVAFAAAALVAVNAQAIEAWIDHGHLARLDRCARCGSRHVLSVRRADCRHSLASEASRAPLAAGCIRSAALAAVPSRSHGMCVSFCVSSSVTIERNNES